METQLSPEETLRRMAEADKTRREQKKAQERRESTCQCKPQFRKPLYHYTGDGGIYRVYYCTNESCRKYKTVWFPKIQLPVPLY